MSADVHEYLCTAMDRGAKARLYGTATRRGSNREVENLESERRDGGINAPSDLTVVLLVPFGDGIALEDRLGELLMRDATAAMVDDVVKDEAGDR